MLRKISIAIAAAIALSAAAMSPAAAGGHGGGHGGHGGGHGMHGGHGHGDWGGGFRHFYDSSAYYVGGSCYKIIFTKFGPRRVFVCNTLY